jgi:hypothetical protein
MAPLLIEQALSWCVNLSLLLLLLLLLGGGVHINFQVTAGQTTSKKKLRCSKNVSFIRTN